VCGALLQSARGLACCSRACCGSRRRAGKPIERHRLVPFRPVLALWHRCGHGDGRSCWCQQATRFRPRNVSFSPAMLRRRPVERRSRRGPSTPSSAVPLARRSGSSFELSSCTKSEEPQ
jgi:hypothetical protein